MKLKMKFVQLKNVFLYLTVCIAGVDAGNIVDVDGSIVMTDSKSFLRAADPVTCDFYQNFNLSEGIKTVSVTVEGNTLKLSENSVTSVKWQLDGVQDVDGSPAHFNQSSANMIQSENASSDGQVYSVVLKDLTANQWRFSGSASMTVRDDTGAGSLVRCKMEMQFEMLDNKTERSEMVSDYVYTPPINVTLNTPTSTAIKIRQPIEGGVKLTFAEDGLAPKVEVVTPYELESNETMITVQKISAEGNDSKGLLDDVKIHLYDIESVIRSTLWTYQNDVGILQLPNLTKDGLSPQAELSVVFAARLEDYASMENGTELKIGVGVKYGSFLIWVSDMSFTTDVPDVENRRPILGLTLSQAKTCCLDGSISLNLEVNAGHEPNSTATAYDVIINMYLLTAMTYEGLQYLPMGYRFNVNQTGSKIQIDIGRLTFSDPTVIVIKEKVNMDDPRVKLSSDNIVVAEVIYNDRWRNKTDFSTPLTHIVLDLNRKCSKRLTWTTGNNCTCLFDTSRQDCACCDVLASQCGTETSDACAPSDQMWRCRPEIDGFYSYSVMSGLASDTYECDAEYKYKFRSSVVSCHRKVSGLYHDVSPLVGLMLGKDDVTGDLVGISNHGRAYVLSKDGGQTWLSIAESDFNVIKSKPTFTPATLI